MTIERYQPLLQEIHTEYSKYVEEVARRGEGRGGEVEREGRGRGRGGEGDVYNRRMLNETKDGGGGRV